MSQPRFFSEMGYCSDSRGLWRYGHPLNHEAVEKRRSLQLLTHPIWWVSDFRSVQEKLLGFLRKHFFKTDTILADECEPHETGKLSLITNDN